jgi:hypothetical protein
LQKKQKQEESYELTQLFPRYILLDYFHGTDFPKSLFSAILGNSKAIDVGDHKQIFDLRLVCKKWNEGITSMITIVGLEFAIKKRLLTFAFVSMFRLIENYQLDILEYYSDDDDNVDDDPKEHETIEVFMNKEDHIVFAISVNAPLFDPIYSILPPKTKGSMFLDVEESIHNFVLASEQVEDHNTAYHWKAIYDLPYFQRDERLKNLISSYPRISEIFASVLKSEDIINVRRTFPPYRIRRWINKVYQDKENLKELFDYFKGLYNVKGLDKL